MATGTAAAADAYLQRLPADLLAAAPAATAWDEIQFVATLAMLVLGAWTVASSGILERIGTRMDRAGQPRWMADAASGGAAGGLIALALLPLALIAALHSGGAPALPAALIVCLRQAAVCSLAGALIAPVLYALMRALPWLWAPLLGGVAAILMFSAVWLPFATASGPTNLPTAPPGPARDGLMQLIAAVHLPAHEIYVSANPAIDADVTGWGQARVVISHGLWISAPPAELRASIGHLMGHYAHHDQLSIALLLAALTFGLFIIVRRLAMPMARLMGLKEVEGPANPVAAPALIAVAVVYIWLAVTCDHAFIRWINVRADQYSLDHAKEPDGLALALLDEWRGEAVDPSPLQEALFYDHPSLKSRIEHAMRWKAAHPTPAPAASGSGA
ncbi:MAG TPA: M48 family metalloprotease [Caulobacteraceae bacterium]|nr:M48 family metalloprotease [Caulobacteraceae bacterium]